MTKYKFADGQPVRAQLPNFEWRTLYYNAVYDCLVNKWGVSAGRVDAFRNVVKVKAKKGVKK